MKLLIVSNLYPPQAWGGYEERCKVVCDALTARGHEIAVLTSHAGFSKPEEIRRDARIHRTLIPVGYFGFPWLRVPALFTAERHNLSALETAIEAHRPEAIHFWNLGGISKSLLDRASDRAPVVTDVSDHWVFRGIPNDPYWSWRERHPILCRLGAAALRGLPTERRVPPALGRVYFTSRSLRELTVGRGFPELADAEVIYCGIPTERFRASVGRPRAGRLRCLFVGRIHADKGVHTACAGVIAAGGGVTLDVFGAGEGDYERDLHRQYGAEPRITFRGRIEPDDMPGVYVRHDCLVFPSEWEEPFALTPLEAAAAGRSIVGTTTGGSKEFLVEDETALTYPAGQEEALAAQLKRLREDPDLAVRLAGRAQEIVLTDFTEEIMVDRIESRLRTAVETA